jgi:hypothetical protein
MHQIASISLFLHPLGYCSGTPGQVDACRGYNFWSGIFSDATIFTGFVAVMLAWWRTHNCHVHGCYRLLWHTHPVHGHPVCKYHHPHTVRSDRVDETRSDPAEVKASTMTGESDASTSVAAEPPPDPPAGPAPT